MGNHEKLNYLMDRTRGIIEGRYNRYSCYLCGGASTMVVNFFCTKEFSERIGAKPGKQRVITYCLCDDCYSKPDFIGLVEARFEKDFCANQWTN